MIDVHDLWKSYGKNHSSIAVLKGLTLHVPSKKILVIMGRSGVGKSVLLRHIMGLEKPDRGFIDVDGVRVSELSLKERTSHAKEFGMLFQGSALFDSMTIGENVAFYYKEHYDYSPSELYDRAEVALSRVGLPGVQKKMPSELSGGQKRRAALARLTIYKPKIILYDEPTTGLDPVTAMQINELIAETHRELHSTTIIVTHDMQSSLFLGDLFALHHEGVITSVVDRDGFLESEDPLIKEFIHNSFINTSRKKTVVHV